MARGRGRRNVVETNADKVRVEVMRTMQAIKLPYPLMRIIGEIAAKSYAKGWNDKVITDNNKVKNETNETTAIKRKTANA